MRANYIYYYKTDTSCEPIGRVLAIDDVDAVEQIAVIKRLPCEIIDELFVVEKIKGDKK